MKAIVLFASVAIISLSSCGSMHYADYSAIEDCQRRKPEDGSKRKIVPWFFIENIVFTGGLGLIVDFCDGAIYYPCDNKAIPPLHYKYHKFFRFR